VRQQKQKGKEKPLIPGNEAGMFASAEREFHRGNSTGSQKGWKRFPSSRIRRQESLKKKGGMSPQPKKRQNHGEGGD